MPETSSASLSLLGSSVTSVSSHCPSGRPEKEQPKRNCRCLCSGAAEACDRTNAPPQPAEPVREQLPRFSRHSLADPGASPRENVNNRRGHRCRPSPFWPRKRISRRVSVNLAPTATHASPSPRSSSFSPSSSSAFAAAGGGLLLLHLARLALLALGTQKKSQESPSFGLAHDFSPKLARGRGARRPRRGFGADAGARSLAGGDKREDNVGSEEDSRALASDIVVPDTQQRCVERREEGGRETQRERGSERTAAAATREETQSARSRRLSARRASVDNKEENPGEIDIAGLGVPRFRTASPAGASSLRTGTERERLSLMGQKAQERRGLGSGKGGKPCGGWRSETVGCGATIKDIGDYLCEHLHQTDSPSFRTNLSRFLRECTDGTLIRQVRRGIYALTARAAAPSASSASPLRCFKRSLWRSVPLSTGTRTDAVLQLQREMHAVEENARETERRSGRSCKKTKARGGYCEEAEWARREDETAVAAGALEGREGTKGLHEEAEGNNDERKLALGMKCKRPGSERREVGKKEMEREERRPRWSARGNGNLRVGHASKRADANPSAQETDRNASDRLLRKSKAKLLPGHSHSFPAGNSLLREEGKTTFVCGPPQSLSLAPCCSSFSSSSFSPAFYSSSVYSSCSSPPSFPALSVSLGSSSAASACHSLSSCSLASSAFPVSACEAAGASTSPLRSREWSRTRQLRPSLRAHSSFRESSINVASTFLPSLLREKSSEHAHVFPRPSLPSLGISRTMRLPPFSSRVGFMTLQKKVRTPSRVSCYLVAETAVSRAALVPGRFAGSAEEAPLCLTVGDSAGSAVGRLAQKVAGKPEGRRRLKAGREVARAARDSGVCEPLRRRLRSSRQDAKGKAEAGATGGPKKTEKGHPRTTAERNEKEQATEDVVEIGLKREKRRKCGAEGPVNVKRIAVTSKNRRRLPKTGSESSQREHEFAPSCELPSPHVSSSVFSRNEGVNRREKRSREQRSDAGPAGSFSSLPQVPLLDSRKQTKRRRLGATGRHAVVGEAEVEPREGETGKARKTTRQETTMKEKKCALRCESGKPENEGEPGTGENRLRLQLLPVKEFQGVEVPCGDEQTCLPSTKSLSRAASASAQFLQRLIFSPKNKKAEGEEERRETGSGHAGERAKEVEKKMCSRSLRKGGRREFLPEHRPETETEGRVVVEAKVGKEVQKKKRESGREGGESEEGLEVREDARQGKRTNGKETRQSRREKEKMRQGMETRAKRQKEEYERIVGVGGDAVYKHGGKTRGLQREEDKRGTGNSGCATRPLIRDSGKRGTRKTAQNGNSENEFGESGGLGIASVSPGEHERETYAEGVCLRVCTQDSPIWSSRVVCPRGLEIRETLPLSRHQEGSGSLLPLTRGSASSGPPSSRRRGRSVSVHSMLDRNTDASGSGQKKPLSRVPAIEGHLSLGRRKSPHTRGAKERVATSRTRVKEDEKQGCERLMADARVADHRLVSGEEDDEEKENNKHRSSRGISRSGVFPLQRRRKMEQEQLQTTTKQLRKQTLETVAVGGPTGRRQEAPSANG
ncbi:hypothetical protein TGGT1_313890 [Toxoplasma gondii GT1]|uniref:Uncharacterized protein n=1 Tax=Toxoplasma gondii (strain ATCC 50853 / GT1) TaxID=507601 RepID=S7UUI0_TOXGG|nr:hypothetical protein TGGT1_313890 [Toxoplasma gondii GT1]